MIKFKISFQEISPASKDIKEPPRNGPGVKLTELSSYCFDDREDENVNSGPKSRMKKHETEVKKSFVIGRKGDVVKTVYNRRSGITKMTSISENGMIFRSVTDSKKRIIISCATNEDGNYLLTLYDYERGTTTYSHVTEDGEVLGTSTLDDNRGQTPKSRKEDTKPPKETENSETIKSSDRSVTSNAAKIETPKLLINRKVVRHAEKGIIAQDSIVPYRYQEQCSRAADRSKYSSSAFEDIADTDDGSVNHPRNKGYLVHFSSDGRKWRTKNEAVINDVLNGDERAINDCGYTEYNSEDGTISWSKSEAIIENKVAMNPNLTDPVGPAEYSVRKIDDGFTSPSTAAKSFSGMITH